LAYGEYRIVPRISEGYRLFNEITDDVMVLGESRELAACRLPHPYVA
jgi:hypothetical protein